jgi:hypothetical protein
MKIIVARALWDTGLSSIPGHDPQAHGNDGGGLLPRGAWSIFTRMTGEADRCSARYVSHLTNCCTGVR